MSKFKKSTLITVVAFILCFTTLVMTAFAATQNLSSYETFKESLLRMPSLENATISGSIKLLDNGNEVLSADISAKMENQNTLSSKSSYTFNGKTESQEQWSNSEQTVWKSSDSDKYQVRKSVSSYINSYIDDNNYTTYVYTSPGSEDISVSPSYSYEVTAIGGGNQKFEDLSASEQKLINAAIDLGMGDIKNYFTSNGNTITLNLEKNQIPQIVQLLVSVMAEKSSSMRTYEDAQRVYGEIGASKSSGTMVGDDFVDFLNNFPKFTDDTTIESANLAVTFDDNKNISAVKGVATVGCTDTDGIYHTLTLDVDFTIINIGTTVADTIDLSDKEVEEHDIFKLDIPTITEYYSED